MLAADRTGAVVDGDELIALAVAAPARRRAASGGGVAVTVMTNYGFHSAMREAGVEVATTAVGDRYVLEALRERGWALGGEQSGHIIDMGFVPSGDGIASALLTLEALAGGDLADRHAMEKLPQTLVNVPRRRTRTPRWPPSATAAEAENARARGPRPRARAPERHRAARARDGRGADGRGVRGRLRPARRAGRVRRLTVAARSSSRTAAGAALPCGLCAASSDTSDGRPAQELLLAGLTQARVPRL